MLAYLYMHDLNDIARTLLAAGKGLLAADESNASADKRLKQYGIETGEAMRRNYRELFLDTPGVEQYISGVIMYEETMHQAANDGTPFAQLLVNKGIVPGIKVDQGLDPFPDEGGEEQITKGLIGLPERLQGFRNMYHPSFTKWRAVIKIDGTRLPTAQAIHENAKRLASYAVEAQRVGMVPLVEPEVLLAGNHSRLRAREVLAQTLSTLMSAMEDQAVDMSGVILKTAMAVSGSESGKTDTPEEVAEDTLGVLMEVVSPKLPGIVFLSGGQTDDQATENLRAICKLAKEKNAPWPLTFSYARALQDEALRAWAGKEENVPAAREAFIARLKKVQGALNG